MMSATFKITLKSRSPAKRTTHLPFSHSRPTRHAPKLTLAAQLSAHTDKGAALILPGFLFSARPYVALRSSLQQRGYATEIVPLTTSMWLPVLFLGNSFEFYLDAMQRSLEQLYNKHGPVSLIGHSAGGWVARLLIGDIPYQGKVYNCRSKIRSLTTLGTPHGSIENYPFGRVSETLLLPNTSTSSSSSASSSSRSIPEGCGTSSLQFCNYFYPTVKELGQGVEVTCIAGNAIRGREFSEVVKGFTTGGGGGGNSNTSDIDSLTSSASSSSSSKNDGFINSSTRISTIGGNSKSIEIIKQPNNSSSSSSGGGGIGNTSGSNNNNSGGWDAYFAYESYKSGCGQGDVDGDGVTPICISHLPGANNIVLTDVWHSQRPRKKEQVWYGDESVVDQWERYLIPDGGGGGGNSVDRGSLIL